MSFQRRLANCNFRNMGLLLLLLLLLLLSLLLSLLLLFSVLHGA